VDEEFIRSELARRAPGRTLLSTQRQETDAYVIESGVWNGHAEGTPICVLIPNTDQHSKDYSLLKDTMRPGHADYAGRVKYKGFNDYRGGGHFSGRLTAPLVWAGALAKQALAADGIVVGAHIARLARIADRPFNPLGETAETLTALRKQVLPTLDPAAAPRMEEAILAARSELDSVGGVVEMMATGLPAGLGDPFFDSLESRLSHALFSVPAVKGRGVRRRLRSCGPAWQPGQRRHALRRRCRQDNDKPQRRDYGRHYERYAGPVPRGCQADGIHCAAPAYGQRGGTARYDPGNQGPPRSVHRTPCRSCPGGSDGVDPVGCPPAGSERRLTMAEQELEALRAEIDKLDSTLVEALEARFGAVRKVAAYKDARHMAVLDRGAGTAGYWQKPWTVCMTRPMHRSCRLFWSRSWP
jgi:hypothetical protein